MSMSSWLLQPGQLMKSGTYRVVRPLSKGGMGALYLVEDLGVFGKLRVIKEMLDYVDQSAYRTQAEYQQAVQRAHRRFEQEARTLASLSHPGIPDILAFFSEQGRNYIVMEYVEGQDLLEGLTRGDELGNTTPGQPYPAEDVIRWGVQVCKVLEYLAQIKPTPVIHHDIKPANLILDKNAGEVRLVDFGTARVRVQPGSQSGLHKPSIYGTAGYAPPEQYAGRSTPKSDVYALAATMYHLLTDDDPNYHPFDFPELDSLSQKVSNVLAAALHQDVQLRLSASQFRAQLEAVSLERDKQPSRRRTPTTCLSWNPPSMDFGVMYSGRSRWQPLALKARESQSIQVLTKQIPSWAKVVPSELACEPGETRFVGVRVQAPRLPRLQARKKLEGALVIQAPGEETVPIRAQVEPLVGLRLVFVHLLNLLMGCLLGGLTVGAIGNLALWPMGGGVSFELLVGGTIAGGTIYALIGMRIQDTMSLALSLASWSVGGAIAGAIAGGLLGVIPSVLLGTSHWATVGAGAGLLIGEAIAMIYIMIHPLAWWS